MLNKEKVGLAIALCRKRCGMTQKQLADILHVTYQSISRWELGLNLPTVEMLYEIAAILGVTVDDILRGETEAIGKIDYSDTGLDVDKLYFVKRKLQKLITEDEKLPRAYFTEPAFFKIDTSNMEDPVYVVQQGVPGSKAKLARKRGCHRELCADVVAGTINNVIRFGAKPVILQAQMITGGVHCDRFLEMGETLKSACEENGVLYGGMEISAQPINYTEDEYVIETSLVGVVDRKNLITGERVQEGDAIIGIITDGINSVSFPFVKVMLNKKPELEHSKIENDCFFIDEILKPNTAYTAAVRELCEIVDVHGIVRVTKSLVMNYYFGMIPGKLRCLIDLSKIKILPLYRFIAGLNIIKEEQIPYLFSCGIGMMVIVPGDQCGEALKIIEKYHDCYVVGEVQRTKDRLEQTFFADGKIQW